MHSLDSSAIVYGWDNYRVSKFPKLWDWLEAEMTGGRLALSSVAYGEIETVSPDCHEWLSDKINRIPMSQSMLASALAFKNSLGIINDQYKSGVGENDLFIIANAKEIGATLISNESIQNNLPTILANYRIPAVCQHIAATPCISFLDYINQSAATF